MAIRYLDECLGSDRLRDRIHIISDLEALFVDYLSFFVWFVNSLGDVEDRLWNKENYRNLLLRCLEDSRIQYELLEDKGKIFIFPKGAEEFDDALVSEPL